MSVRIEIEPLKLDEKGYYAFERGDLPYPDELLLECNGKAVNKLFGGRIVGIWSASSDLGEAILKLMLSQKQANIHVKDNPLNILLERIDVDLLRVSVKYGLDRGNQVIEPNKFVEDVGFTEFLIVAIDAINIYADRFEKINGDRANRLPYSIWILGNKSRVAMLENAFFDMRKREKQE